MAKLMVACSPRAAANLRIYDDDATQLLDWLPAGRSTAIDLLYPDPWPKKKHWKRRFVNETNLDRFARVMKPGGLFHFASDIDTYVNWTLLHCRAHPAFEWQARIGGRLEHALRGVAGNPLRGERRCGRAVARPI
jgi:tRNA (guanine-N7-)-methyltransferase